MPDEYILTNTFGSYCSSTFFSNNTRKYHGLLVIADENLGRKVILNRLEEKLTLGDSIQYLSGNWFCDHKLHPDTSMPIVDKKIGFESVTVDYNTDTNSLSKTVELDELSNLLKVSYKFNLTKTGNLTIKPMLSFRNVHGLTTESGLFLSNITFLENKVILQISNEYDLIISSLDFKFKRIDETYYDFFYPQEELRGYASNENLAVPILAKADIPKGNSHITLSFEIISINDQKKNEISGRNYNFAVTNQNKVQRLSYLTKILETGSRHFIIHNSQLTTINAGYHWFSDWSRDTFISFKGLLLNRWLDKYELAKNVLITWAKFEKNGLLPNQRGINTFNSADGSLWFVLAAYEYLNKTSDINTLKAIWGNLTNIIFHYIAGTDNNINMHPNGLIYCGNPTTNLTWMDAQIDSKPITPRYGYAVEIQFLWYNTVMAYRSMSKMLKIPEDPLLELITKQLPMAFISIFWSEDKQYFADFVNENETNWKFRPNQMLGFSLPFQICDSELSKSILTKVEKVLWTSAGLMTLAKDDPDFEKEYTGTQKERDIAYHNGTIWPWLLFIFLKSYLNIYGSNADSKKYIYNKLEVFGNVCKEKKLSYLPEVFSPKDLEPNGCLLQAWNYGLLIEIMEAIF